MLLEQYYETTETVLQVAGEAAAKRVGIVVESGEKLNIEFVMQAKKENMLLRLNVGMGATNPLQKVQNLTFAVQSANALDPQGQLQQNGEELRKEVFASLGYQDGSRFKLDEPVEAPPSEAEINAQLEQAKLENNLQIAQMQEQTKVAIAQIEGEIKMAAEEMRAMASDKRSERDVELRRQVGVLNDKTKRDIEATKAANFSKELNFKATTGKEGI